MGARGRARGPAGARAVVMAGGAGTRLQPYTTLIPKPLVPIGDRPILGFVLRGLREAGFREVTLCVGRQAELIQAYFGDGKKWGLRLEYAVETRPLSTIGPLAYVEDLGQDFLVMNGDVLTDMDLARFYWSHRRSGADLTVATRARKVRIDYGVLTRRRGSRRVRAFAEKPVIEHEVSMGIYMLNRRCLRFVRRGKALGFDELVEILLRRGRPVMAYPYRGRWLDVGRPEDYELAQSWRWRKDERAD
jgi:NDP-sugar pyrophosphorylase family protein